MRTLLASLALSLFACSGPPGTCSYDGKSYMTGATFPSSDGCNTCSCLAGGGVACTERACASLDGGGDAAGDVVMCAGMAPTFPTFGKACGVAADCEIALHQINCCGSLKALGISTTESGRFKGAEATCRAQYPSCGCPTLPIVAEDGKSSVTGGDVAVDCKAGACTTYIR